MTLLDRARSLTSGGLLAAGVLLVLVGGCAQQPPGSLIIASTHGRFNQVFTAAYHAQVTAGDRDIVLLDGAAKAALDGHPTDSPVRQVVRLRVLWNATRDLKADHTSSSNATLHWYVLGNTTQTANQVIEYSGTAMVVLEQDGSDTLCSIRGASMRMVAKRGTLSDPIGLASLKGTIRATDNPPIARRVLAEVRDLILADLSQSQNSLPPLADKASSMAR